MARKSRKAAVLKPALVLLALLLGAFSPTWAQSACRLPANLAEALLDGDELPSDLPIQGAFTIDEQALLEQNLHRATIELAIEPGPLELQPEAVYCFFIVLDVDGETRLGQDFQLKIADFANVESLRYVTRLDLPEGTSQMIVVAREERSGLLGAQPLESPALKIKGPGLQATRVESRPGSYYEIAWRDGAAPPKPTSSATATDPAEKRDPADDALELPDDDAPARPRAVPSARPRARDVVIRLVPPREEPATGSTLFNCLVSSEAVDRVIFEVDGKRVAERSRRPFREKLTLASPAREQKIRAIALDATGATMGEDVLVVNALDAPFRVRISDFKLAADRLSAEIVANVSVPRDQRLVKVEIARNGDPAQTQTLTQPPWRARVALPGISAEDFVQVSATLADGRVIDDVVLIAAPESIDEVEVNLAEIRVVVVDDKGRPRADLKAEDFQIEAEGKSQAPQGFAYAQDVPLVLGLMIDASGSMELLMHDTRKAAGKFIGQTLQPKDQAFLVDFDLQPRLLQTPTAKLQDLLLSLGRVNAGGRTAMYDAVVFALLQFRELEGRKALVILSDGDDLDSRFGPKECAEMGRELGVPIYIIALGALDSIPRTFNKSDLRKITEDSAGQVFFVNSFEELGGAYAQINSELRSQYTLSFYTDKELTTEQRRKVKVKVKDPKLKVRTVVGAG
jgi:Ca-activated chloride channel homolog